MPRQSENNGIKEPEKTHTRGASRRDVAQRYKNTSRDLESQATSSQTAPFPGATYGFNPNDQPAHPPRRVASKASLRPKKSFSSLRADPNAPPVPDTNSATQDNPDGDPDESLAEELAWNPSHPCFPHPNPHVPLNSPAYESTRIIRIKRDWMAQGDLAPAYSNIYPEILDPLLPESEFRFLINHINASLFDAFDAFSASNWIDGFLGLATGWLWEDFRPGGLKGKLKALEFWIETWNKNVGARDGVRVVPLRRTGYMNLDIEIPDPQVRVVDPDAPVDADEGVEAVGAEMGGAMNEAYGGITSTEGIVR